MILIIYSVTYLTETLVHDSNRAQYMNSQFHRVAEGS